MSLLKVNSLIHSTGSSNNINLDSSGRVGIGNTSPGYTLTVSGQGYIQNSSIVSSTTGSHLTLENSNTTQGQSSVGYTFGGVAKSSIRGDFAGNLVLNANSSNYFFSNDLPTAGGTSTFYQGPSSTIFMQVTGNTVYYPGSVGIGTSPSYLLDVYTASTATDYYAAKLLSGAAGSGTSTTHLRLEKGTGYGGTVGGYINQGVGSGLVFSTLNGGTLSNVMWIATPGNVGIGTNSPGALLEANTGSSSGIAIKASQPIGLVASAPTIRGFGYSPSFELLNKDSTQNWYFGINDNDSKKLYIGRGYGPNQGVTPAINIDTSDNVTIPTGQIISTRTGVTTTNGGQIFLNGATSNRIDFVNNGVNPPAFTTRSTGTKIVLWSGVDATNVDFALGIENSTMWFSVPSAATQFKWYSGTTNIMLLNSVNLSLAVHALPSVTGTYNLGSSSLRWANLYTSDLNLSNDIGDYTIVEGEEDLFLYNNKNGKVFKFALIEVDKSEAPPKKE